jgi:hypothetical protein
MRKDPQAVLDYGVNWGTWLADGETITTSTWEVTPTGLTVDSDTADTTTATIWLSGGVAGTRYAATNHIATSQGRQDQRTIHIDVANR